MAGKKKNARMGRPPKKATDRRSMNLTIRLTQKEYDQLARDAEQAGHTKTDYLRNLWLKSRSS